MAEFFRQFRYAAIKIVAQLRRRDLAVGIGIGKVADAVDDGLGEGAVAVCRRLDRDLVSAP